MTPIDLVVVGATGRLGRLVVCEAVLDARFAVHAVARRPEVVPDIIAGHARLKSTGEDLGDCLAQLSDRGRAVVVDVTTAGGTARHAALCAGAGVPLVVATTGLGSSDVAALTNAAAAVPVLQAANLSLGAHLLAALAEQAAGRLPDADVEIVEVHHRGKRDAPSGTALMLARSIEAGRGAQAMHALGRSGEAPRVEGEIGIAAVRGGDVVGEHTVSFFLEGERVELVHRATDRAIFARGALAAAAFLVGKAGRLYSMRDVIGIG